MSLKSTPVRVRFAPSPTGLLHVGNVRVALINYLFVRKCGGTFVLRIDDSDKERSTKESEEQILSDVAWLGIKYDEFYRQSERTAKYREAFEKLLAAGRVYSCYETKEELALKRKTQTMSGIPPVYDRASLKLTDAERKQKEADGARPYWRFRLNDGENAEWDDLIHGHISIPLSTVSDPVIVRPDGGFMYTFASVVDDADLGITHIIRGDDHVTNTSVQIDLFKALGEVLPASSSSRESPVPQFAHMPLMSALDGQEISKRTGSPLSIINMRKDGILPEAIIDVLANLGTSNNVDPKDTFATLIEKFDFKKMSLASPKFNLEDVRLINKKVIAEKSFEDVKDEVREVLSARPGFKCNQGGGGNEEGSCCAKIRALWDTVKGNIEKISDISLWYEVLCGNAVPANAAAAFSEEDCGVLRQMLETLAGNSDHGVDFDAWIQKLKEVSGKKGRDLFHPMRMALTGLENGPELRKIVQFLGYDAVKMRIEACLNRK